MSLSKPIPAEDWKSEASLASFRERIAAEQRAFGRICQRWFEYKQDQIPAIKLRIAGSLFEGGPDGFERGMVRVTDVLHSYAPEQRKVVEKIFKVLMKTFTKDIQTVKVSRVMVGLKNAERESRLFILAVRTDAAEADAFIDHMGRRYRSWGDFMRNNRLPSGYMVFPQNGIYREGNGGEFMLDNAWLKTGFNLAMCLDYVAAVFGVVGGAVLFASIFCPLIAPIILTGAAVLACASSLWGGIRCGQGLHDLSTHGQSLASKEAALLWAGLIAAVVGGVAAVGTGVTSGVLQLADEVTLGVRLHMGLRILRTTSACLSFGGGISSVCAIAKVGSGRLSPAAEAAMIGLGVFMSGNVVLSMDQAHKARMLAASIADGDAEGVSADASIERTCAAMVEFLRRQAGVNIDAQDLPVVAAYELSDFEGLLSETASAAFLTHVVRLCQESTANSSAAETDSTVGTAHEATEEGYSSGEDEWHTIR